MKVALVHYWLVTWRGGEQVLQALCNMFPAADVFTHVFCPETCGPPLAGHRISTTFINKLPYAQKYYQYYLPLMPLAQEQLDLREYDLVISSESGPAKGVITSPDSLHLCYCHSPMRYVWDRYHDYIDGMSWYKRMLIAPMLHYMRLWDHASASRVDGFIANSAYVQKRIQKCYRRSAKVVHPPVAVEQFPLCTDRDDFYLMAGQLVPYKRPDLAIRAFNSSGKKLVVIGTGAMEKELRRIAAPNITFLGHQPLPVLKDHYARCRALVFPGIEDFGIVPLEAMSSGAPVLAMKAGGALETVLEGKTGLFFAHQTEEALQEAITRFEATRHQFIPQVIHDHAQTFAITAFTQRMEQCISDASASGGW